MITLGKSALDGKNYEQAHEYFSKVLEQVPDSVDAWIGKGQSAGWQSTLANLRFAEMLQCFSKALVLTQNSQLDEVTRIDVSLNAFLISHAVFETSVGHVLDFISVPQAIYDHIDRCKSIIDVLEYSHRINPELKEAPELIIEISNRMLKTGRLADDEKDLFSALITKYAIFGKPAAKSNSSCFVVTATFGRPDHIMVRILRLFRDRILTRSRIGISFIEWYYRHGPFLADLIRHNKLLRLLTLVIIVVPALFFAVPALGVQSLFSRVAHITHIRRST